MMKFFALRLNPGQDLKQSLKEFTFSAGQIFDGSAYHLQAAFILSAIGSLSQATIRFADQKTSEVLTGKFEILSINGTLSIHGIHLHIAISDATGKTIGGHLDYGCIVYTTAEIVIGESEEFTFLRSPDRQTGFLELEIRPRDVD